MRKQTYTAVIALTFISSISAALAIASIGSAAYAVEFDSAICQQALRPATTGGATREQLEARAKCRSQSQPLTNLGASIQSPVNTSTNTKAIDTNQPTSRVDDPNLASCLSPPSWVKPEDWEYREAVYFCKYGS